MIPSLLLAVALLQAVPETYSLRAVVLDGKNAPVRDLEINDISLTENGVTVPVTRFEKDERETRVALLIDSSQPFATAYRLHFLDAAKSFVASLPETTRVTVWTTGDRPTKIIDDLSLAEEGSGREIANRLARVAPQGGNTILDALVEAAQDLQKKEGMRNVVFFLTGDGPGFSNDERQSLTDRVLKTGVEVMGTVISERGDGTAGGDVTQDEYDYVFTNLTDRTGGRLERTLSVMGAGAATMRVAADLRSTYRLAFQSSGAKRSKIALQVARPSVKVRLSTPQKETSSP